MAGGLFDWGEHNEKYEKIKILRKARKEFSRQQTIYKGKTFKGFSAFNFSKRGVNAKPAVIKMLSNLGKSGVKNAINYIIRNSENDFAFNELGERVSANDILKDWAKDFSKNENAKEAWHLCFSIKENAQNPKNILALKESVKQVMKDNFYGHKYALVIHTHQNQPHIHIVVNKLNRLTKQKIHFKQKGEIKDFFNDVRENFALNLGIRGLNYANKNALEKDLSKEYSKIKQKEILDDTNTKDNINEIYLQARQNFQNKSHINEKKAISLRNDYEELKTQRNDLLQLLDQHIQNRSKRRFKVMKQIKEINIKLRMKEKAMLKNLDEKRNLFYKLQKINDDYAKHFKEQTSALNMQKNFIFAFKRTYPNFKGASKTDMANFEKIQRAMQTNSLNQEKDLTNFTQENVIYSKMFNKEINLFKLNKQFNTIDDNIYILKNSNISLEKQDDLIKRLESNKDFIKQISEARFNNLEKKIAKLEKGIDKNSWIYKEYVKGVEYLQRENKFIKSKTVSNSYGYSRSKTQENSRDNIWHEY